MSKTGSVQHNCQTKVKLGNAEIGAKSTANNFSRSIEGVVEVISSSCWFVRGSFEGIDSELLVDSGSTYTIVDVELFRSFPRSVQSRLVDCNVLLRSANGELLQVFGEVILGLELDGKVYDMSVKVVALGGK